MATKDPNYWKNLGDKYNINIAGFHQPTYNIIGSSFDIGRFSPKSKNPPIPGVGDLRNTAIEFMNKGGLNTLGPTDIFKGVAAGSYYKTNPQYVLKQFVGANGLRDGMTVFGFDIEALGSFGPEAKSGIFAPTELAMRAYKFNGTNPREYDAWRRMNNGTPTSSMKLKSYFDLLDGGELTLARRLDDNEVTYVEGLLTKLGNRNSLHDVVDISQDDLRSLRDLMKYAEGAEFRNGGVYGHNGKLPAESLLTSSHVGKIKEGLRNLQAHGLQTDEFLRRANAFVEQHTRGSMDKAFKVMAYNGTQYDVPGLEYKFGDRLDLLHGNKHARYTGNIDWYATANALYSDPVKRIYRDAYNAQQINLTQGAVANYLFGWDTTGAHAAHYDIGMQEDIANFFMNDVNRVYMNGNRGALNVNGMLPLHMRPTPGGNAMAVYNPGYIDIGDRLYAHSGVGGSSDSVFDMVFKFNNGKYDYLNWYNNPISTSKTYQMKGMFNMNGPNNQALYGMVLYNEDDDLHHMILRDDPRKLQNLVHEKFSYLGKDTTLDMVDKQSRGLVRTYADAARREYLKMFTPSMDQEAGDSLRLLKTYLEADEKVQMAISSGRISQSEIAQHGRGLIRSTNIDKISDITGLSYAKARNYAYMRGRLQSESSILRPFVGELEKRGVGGWAADLALYNLKSEMDSRAGEYLESIAPKHGAEQMFIFDPVRHEYRLADTADVSRLTSTINTIVTQGKDPAQYKQNAHQIVNDLHDRGYLNGDQMERLHKLVSKMDATEVESARSTQFMRSVASEVMNGKWNSQASMDDFIRKTTKEFFIANSIQKSGDVASGVAPTDYFYTKVKGGVKANYLQESVKTRKFDAGTLDYLRSSEVTDRAISGATRVQSHTPIGSGSALKWDREALAYFKSYDDAMIQRLRAISNPNMGIDFAKDYRGLGSALDNLAAAYMHADPEHATAVAAALSEDKHSLVMVVYNKADTAKIMREGSLRKDARGLRTLEIPLADMMNNTIQVGRQDIMNPIFLELKYGAQAQWHNVQGLGLTEEIIKQYRIGVNNIMQPMLRGGVGNVEDFNRAARMHMNKALQRASGSGRLIGTVEEEAMDASNQAVMWQRGAYVNISGLTGIIGAKPFDELFEDTYQSFMRKISDSAREHGLNFTFQGVKDTAALHGIISSVNSRAMVPFGAYGANTRFNYQQYNSYYNLGKYDIYNKAEDWRFGRGLVTDTSYNVVNRDLPEIGTKVAWMNDDQIMAAARAAGIAEEGSLLSTAEGMAVVSENLKKYMTVRETKRIEIPHGMDLSPEMLELLQRAEESKRTGGEVYIPDWGPGNKFTVAQAQKDAVRTKRAESDILFNNKFKTRVIGQTEYNGKAVIELEQILHPEDGMKVFFGTDKFTIRFAPQNVLDKIGGTGIDAIIGSEMSKRRDYNNVISGVVNQAMEEARRSGKATGDIATAFKDTFGIDLDFRDTKMTIGKDVIDRTVPVMPDMLHDFAGAKRIDPKALMSFREALGLPSQPAGNILTGMQGMRISMVSRYPVPFGGEPGLDEGVRYGLRELEVIRGKRISIDGKEYGTAGSTYKWFNDTIDGRASKKFNGRYDKFLGRLDTTLRSFNDASISGEAPTYWSREASPGALRFQEMKEIVGTDGLTRADLRGTVLNPGVKGNGFWLETPFDWTIDGQSIARNKVFMMKDDIRGVDGNLYLTEIQKQQLAIERYSREFVNIQEGKIVGPLGTLEEKQKMLDEAARKGNTAVNSYIQQLGKDAMGSHGRVAYDMMSAKLGNSGHFTIAGMNVYGNGSEWDNAGKAVSSNTSFISEEYARKMLTDSGLSKEQISDIIDVMSNGEGAFSVTNRYPTFDQGALIFGRTKISGKLTGDQAVISIGDAAMLKADYDGDHLSKVLAFANYVKDSGMKYSDLLAAADENYQKIVAGNLKLGDIKSEHVRAFTEFRMLSEADNRRSVTLGNYIRASYTKDVKFDKMRVGNLDFLQTLTEKGKTYEEFGELLPGAGSAMSDEFLSREARIMKAVGSASNLNARMRRMAEALTKTPEYTYTIGKEMTKVTTGAMLYNSLLPQDVWDEVSTIASINEQSGISSKHILPLMEKFGYDAKTITAQQQERVFETLKLFKSGLEHFDVNALTKAQEQFEMLGMKDILRLGSGEVTSASIEEAFKNGLEGASETEIKDFMDSFRYLGNKKGDAVNELIKSVGVLGRFTDAYDFSNNPYIKYSLSSPSSSMKAIEGWQELTNPHSDYFVPTDEVKRLYRARGKMDDFEIGAQKYADRMSQINRDAYSKFIGGEGNNFARLTDEIHPMKTVGDDALERAATKVFDHVGGKSMANAAIGGALGFGALWAASAIFRKGPEEDSVEMPQADQAPSSDGKYVDPSVFGPAPAGAAPLAQPTARVAMRGGGYENVNITINAQNSSMSEAQIRDIVQQQLRDQMPMDVNMNVNSRDNTQVIDRQWVNETVTKAMRFGYAY